MEKSFHEKTCEQIRKRAFEFQMPTKHLKLPVLTCPEELEQQKTEIFTLGCFLVKAPELREELAKLKSRTEEKLPQLAKVPYSSETLSGYIPWSKHFPNQINAHYFNMRSPSGVDATTFDKFDDFGSRWLRAVLTAAGSPTEYTAEILKNGSKIAGIFEYVDNGKIGMGAHEDFGFMTVCFESVLGIMHNECFHWVKVPDDCICIQFGLSLRIGNSNCRSAYNFIPAVPEPKKALSLRLFYDAAEDIVLFDNGHIRPLFPTKEYIKHQLSIYYKPRLGVYKPSR